MLKNCDEDIVNDKDDENNNTDENINNHCKDDDDDDDYVDSEQMGHEMGSGGQTETESMSVIDDVSYMMML